LCTTLVEGFYPPSLKLWRITFIRSVASNEGKKNPGDDLLSRLCGSIIGSAGLNCWVRNGTRCDPRDIIARKPFRCNFLSLLRSIAAEPHFFEEKKSKVDEHRNIFSGYKQTSFATQKRLSPHKAISFVVGEIDALKFHSELKPQSEFSEKRKNLTAD